MNWKVNFIICLLAIVLLLGVFLSSIDKIENIFGVEIDFIPEDELLHPEGYTFPPETDLERNSVPLFFDFFENL